MLASLARPIDAASGVREPSESLGKRSGRRKNRTFNKRIKSPLLYQLSYAPGTACLVSSVFVFVLCFLRGVRGGGASGGNRTPNPRLRRPMLYPIELRALGRVQMMRR